MAICVPLRSLTAGMIVYQCQCPNHRQQLLLERSFISGTVQQLPTDATEVWRVHVGAFQFITTELLRQCRATPRHSTQRMLHSLC